MNDQIRVTVHVRLPPAIAFEVFTTEIDQWWRRGPQFRNAGRNPGTMYFECKLGGRLLETWQSKNGATLFEVGRITAWEPPRRFSFEWRASNFEPPEKTDVDVTFEPMGEGTNVIVVHRGFGKLRPDHPVRHGEPDARFLRRMALWWGDLMTSMREHTQRR